MIEESYMDMLDRVNVAINEAPPPMTAAERMVRAKQTKFRLELVLGELNIMTKRMLSLDTAHEFIGLDGLVGKINACSSILAGGYDARWPERAKMLKEAGVKADVVDLRTIRRGA